MNVKLLFRLLVVTLTALLVSSHMYPHALPPSPHAPSLSVFTPVDSYEYPDNMSMVIELKSGGETVDTCEVAAFIDGECRGASRAIDGLYYLTIAGEGSGQKIEIATCLKGRIVTIDSSISYVTDLIIGMPWEPYVIELGRTTADVNGDGAVNVADIASVIECMSGSTAVDVEDADVNGDGVVNVADIATIIDVMAALSRASKSSE